MDQEELAKLLRRRRRQLKLGVQEVATRAGVSTELWYAIEAGRYPAQVKPETKAAMLEALAVVPGAEELSEPDIAAQLAEVLEELRAVRQQLAELLGNAPPAGEPANVSRRSRRRSAGGAEAK